MPDAPASAQGDAAYVRGDDARLLALADHLDPTLAVRLRELIRAPEGAAAYLEQRNKAERAEDLANECRRQLRSMIRQVDRLRAEARGVASEASDQESPVTTSTS